MMSGRGSASLFSRAQSGCPRSSPLGPELLPFGSITARVQRLIMHVDLHRDSRPNGKYPS
jgi:hypothetical protein